MNWYNYLGKRVTATLVDGKIFDGFVNGITSPGDSEENMYEVTMETDKYKYLCLLQNELKSIEVIE